MATPSIKPCALLELGAIQHLAQPGTVLTDIRTLSLASAAGGDSFGQGNPVMARGDNVKSAPRSILVRNAPQPGISSTKVNIREIHSEAELLSHLFGGKRVILYRGFKRDHLPEIGKPYGKHYIHLSKPSLREEAIERVRLAHFPEMPSRIASVFAASSPAEARLFGEVYELEISLRENARNQEGHLPIRWLDRTIFEDLAWEHMRTAGAEPRVEKIKAYLSSSGHHRSPSDILINPKLVEVIVREYRPPQEEKIGDIVDGIFSYDPAGYSSPFDLEGLIERLEDGASFFQSEGVSPDLVRRAAVKRLVMKMLDDLPTGYFNRGPQELIDDTVHSLLRQSKGIRRIIEEENPFAGEDDPDYQSALSILDRYDALLTDYGHAFYLNNLIEKSRLTEDAVSPDGTYYSYHLEREIGAFKRAVEWYHEACDMAGVASQSEKVHMARIRIGQGVRSVFFGMVEDVEEVLADEKSYEAVRRMDSVLYFIQMLYEFIDELELTEKERSMIEKIRAYELS